MRVVENITKIRQQAACRGQTANTRGEMSTGRRTILFVSFLVLLSLHPSCLLERIKSTIIWSGYLSLGTELAVEMALRESIVVSMVLGECSLMKHYE